MPRFACLLALFSCIAAPALPSASAGVLDNVQLKLLQRRLSGRIVEHTHNHGQDRRIWSDALQACRDVYVYLPPCYDPSMKYPVIFYLHGFLQDERSFFLWVPELDAAIRKGCFPPTIVIAADGSITGEPNRKLPASFYINSKAGRFEDFLMCDIWNWAHQNFSIRPEREAHAFVGVSMGGGAAFDLGIRHRDKVGQVVGVFPPLNVRWVDCKGRAMGNFDPNCWGWRENLDRPRETIGRFYAGLIRIPISMFVQPLFGMGNESVAHLAEHNPIEVMMRTNLKDGELNMYVAYAGCDEFNLDAQAESFLYVARERGIRVDVDYKRFGKHNAHTAFRMLPGLLCWLGNKLAPYGPIPCSTVERRAE